MSFLYFDPKQNSRVRRRPGFGLHPLLSFSLTFSAFFTAPFSAASFGGQLRFMTYNAAFLPFVSKQFKARKSEFARSVAQLNPDVISLQEVWMPKTRNDLISDFKKQGYPYAGWIKSGSFFSRGFMGHGLLVISKFPLAGPVKFSPFHRYTQIEEYFARKGVLKVPLRIPGLGELDVYDTHLGAVSFSKDLGDFRPEDLNRNSQQLDEALDFIRREAEPSVPFLFAGDFNFHPTKWQSEDNGYSPVIFRNQYSRIKETLNASDVFSEDTPLRDPEKWLTFDPTRNPIIRGSRNSVTDYTSKRELRDPDPRSRFDYIWYPVNSAITLVETRVVMDDRQGPILSDHFAIEALFEFCDL